MKQFIMKHLMLSCRQACFLMAKKEEGQLNAVNRLQLRLHTSMCAICKRFEKQTRLITGESSSIDTAAMLRTEAREQIRRAIHDCR